MNTRILRAIMRKDLLTILQNKGVWMPIVLVPIIFLVILPTVAIVIPSQINMVGSMGTQMDLFLRNMPAALRQQVAGMSEAQTMIYLFIVYLFAPFFLIIPMMVSSVIGADSFAGEKERKTLEALLYTPATDMELFVGKVLTAWVPAVLISWGSFLIYTVVVNALGYSQMGRLFFPNMMWIPLMLWVVPAASALALSVMVLVSTKVKTFQEANQLGSTVVIPILLLVFGQIGGVMYFSVPVVLLVGLVFWIIDVVLIRIGVRTFARGELIARL